MMNGIRAPNVTDTAVIVKPFEDRDAYNKMREELYAQPNPNIVVYVNSRSGGMKGGKLLKPLRDMFGDDKVVDLLEKEPYGAQETLRTHFNRIENLKIVVCGGDGTVQWVLADIDKLISEGVLSDRPGVAILPLGTGNDLSRQFGWGHGYRTRLLKDLRADVSVATGVALDRWNIELHSKKHVTGVVHDEMTSDEVENIEMDLYKCCMSNYFGIGLDAKVVHNFEGCRKGYPGLFCCRCSNNFIYGWFGLTNCIRNPLRIKNFLKISANGQEIADVPDSCQGISIINLRYFGAGIDMWKSAEQGTCSINDGMMEMFSFRGALYLALVKAGATSPKQLKQASEIVIESLNGPPGFTGNKGSRQLKIQIDGETQILFAPFKIIIRHAEQQAVLLQGKRPAVGTCDVFC